MQQRLASWLFLGFFVAFCCFFFLHFKSQTTRRTDDDLEFIVQHKFNQVFEYSDNDGENFKQLSPYLAYHGEDKVTPSSIDSKHTLVSV